MTNIAAESLLLSCFVQRPQTFFDVCDYMKDEDFESDGHAMIFLATKSLLMDKSAEQISKVKLIAEAKSLGFENFKAATRDYELLDQVLKNTVQESDGPRYFQEVKRQSLIRKYDTLFRDKREYLRTTKDSLSSMISTIESEVFQLPDQVIDAESHAVVNMGKEARGVIDSLAETPGQVGLDIGLPVWQNRAGQIRNGGVTFIVATAKTGKSQFGLAAGVHVATHQRLPVLLCDSELSKPDQIVRMVGIMAKVPYAVIETGYWKMTDDQLLKEGISQADLPKFQEYRRRMNDQVLWDKVSKLPIDYMSIAGMPMADVLPRIRRWIMTRVKPTKDAKFPECLIIYDYVKLATLDELGDGKYGEHQIHGINVASLHDLCKRYMVPCLAFGQTNRQLDTDANCVAGAKRIIDNITSLTLLKRKTEEELGFDPSGNHFLRVFLSRFGSATPVGHVNINFDKSFGEIHELGYSGIDFASEKAKKLEEWKNKKYRKKDDDDDE